MINDASTPTLPRERRGVQHAFFTDERVARDSAFFEPHIPPRTYSLVFFVSSFRRSLDEVPYGRGARSTVMSTEADGFERVTGE